MRLPTMSSLTSWTMLALLLASRSLHADVFPRDDIILDPEPGRFSVCHGNGCVNLSLVSLAPEQWREITDPPFPNFHGTVFV